MGTGTLRYTLRLKDGEDVHGELRDVTWVPDITARLLSVCQLVRSGYTAAFKGMCCELRGPGGNTINVPAVEQVYPLQLHIKRSPAAGSANLMFTECSNDQLAKRLDGDEWLLATTARTEVTWMDLHRMMGHLNLHDCKKLTEGAAKNVRVTDTEAPLPLHSDCLACIEGRQTRLPFAPGRHRADGLLDLIHMDTVGPMETQSYDGKRYALTLVDDKSRICTMEPMAAKDGMLYVFKAWKVKVENSCQRKICAVMCDNAKEFVQGRFKAYLDEQGIQLYTSVPHSPQMNGIAERMNRTIVEGARAMLLEAKLPKRYWTLAFRTMAYLRNRSPTRANEGKTPYEVFYGEVPDISNLRPFGCQVSVHTAKTQKLDARSWRGYMVGYEPWDGGYVVLEPKTGKVHRARNVIFHEASLGPIIPVTMPSQELAANDDLNEVPNQPSVPTAQGNERLTIRIPAHPKQATEPAPNADTLMSTIPDYPAGTTRSGRTREPLAGVAFEFAMSAIAGQPLTDETLIAVWELVSW